MYVYPQSTYLSFSEARFIDKISFQSLPLFILFGPLSKHHLHIEFVDLTSLPILFQFSWKLSLISDFHNIWNLKILQNYLNLYFVLWANEFKKKYKYRKIKFIKIRIGWWGGCQRVLGLAKVYQTTCLPWKICHWSDRVVKCRFSVGVQMLDCGGFATFLLIVFLKENCLILKRTCYWKL